MKLKEEKLAWSCNFFSNKSTTGTNRTRSLQVQSKSEFLKTVKKPWNIINHLYLKINNKFNIFNLSIISEYISFQNVLIAIMLCLILDKTKGFYASPEEEKCNLDSDTYILRLNCLFIC